MNSAHVYVGRLLEVRVETGYRTVDEVEAIFRGVGRELANLPSTVRSVNAVDWRRCPVMTGEGSNRLLQLMAQYDDRIERSATLVSRDAPTAMMQFVRVLRENTHPQRRLFCEVEEMQAWLDEVLTYEESVRLRGFLSYQQFTPQPRLK